MIAVPPQATRLTVAWYAVTDSVVICDSRSDEEIEISREEWIQFVEDIKAGKFNQPWLPSQEPSP